ncbi:MAG: hypothetical protein PWQ43_747 [Rikenellaceae bacterium]|nr:hypothetical protein [Rikenellaceae bacterium]
MEIEEFKRIVKKTNDDLYGRAINFGTLAYVILKTLELKEQGITSRDFEVPKIIFNDDFGKKERD